MIHADKIHKWLARPDSLPGTEKHAVDGLAEKYPYCIPVRYLQAALAQQEAPFSPDMLGRMQLFTGNWFLYYQLLQQAAGIAITPQQLTAAAAMEMGDALADAVNREIRQEQTGALTAGAEAPVVIPPQEKPAEPVTAQAVEDLLQPVSAEDYFLHQGIRVPDTLPEAPSSAAQEQPQEEKDKSLMVVMSFSEWLQHFKTKSDREREEEEGQKALRTMWQKEKLAAALEDEVEEIPEAVFTMAVNSISREEDLVSEPLATILIRQGKYDKAIEMYRKLSLRNPQKSAYFARQIEKIQKEKEL